MISEDFYDRFRQGSALWATDRHCKAAELDKRGGVYIGQSPERGFDMTLDGDAPITLIGGAGNGKTADLVMYSALYPGNMLTLDPKGEIGAVTAGAHRKAGKEVRCINPAGLHTGAPWNLPMDRVNPLDILTPDSPTLDGDTEMTMEALIPLSGGREDFFDLSARHWCAPLMKHMVVQYGEVNLVDFHRLMSMIEGNPEGFQALAREELSTSPLPETRTTARKIVEKQKSAPREFSSVMSTIDKNLNFLTHREIKKTVSGADFSLSMLAERPSVVFLVIPPEYMEMWRSFIRLCITVAALYKQRRPSAASVLYMLDELATLGRFEMAERLYNFGRGGGNRVFGVLQSVAQTRVYGPKAEQIFLSSSQARLFKGCRDLETAEMIASMCGSQTIEVENPRYQAQSRLMRQRMASSVILGGADPFQAGMELAHWKREQEHREKIQRPLLLPAEALNLPDNRMIAFISGKNCPPIAAQTTPYYKRRDLRRYFMPHPFHM